MAAKKKGRSNRTTNIPPPPPPNKSLNRPKYHSNARLSKALEAEYAFVNRYLVDRNGTKSVMECGAYKPKNKKVAGVMANELLARPSVKAMLAAASAKQRQYLEARYEVTADRIIRELAYIGFANMNEFVTVQQDGSAYLDLSMLDDPDKGYALGAAIRKLETEHYTEHSYDDDGEDRQVKKIKLELHDKRTALLELGKVTGDPRFRDVDANKNPVFQAQQMMIIYQGMEKTLFGE